MTIYLMISIEKISLFGDEAMVNLSNFEHIGAINNELNRIYLFGFVVLNFVLTFSVEKIFVLLFPDDTNESRKSAEKASEKENKQK